ncbi:jg884 [Pararge aegeria aegeria]|uniref:Jg884 protein n=1 Tax=Pararge aegeria aegeria TaxID=348720 RepID=A0A8S4R3N6_9NEOP|nr:jg884 [Pararge aegeria aegeria]
MENSKACSSTAVGETVIIAQKSKAEAFRQKHSKTDMKSGYTTEYMTETDMLAVRLKILLKYWLKIKNTVEALVKNTVKVLIKNTVEVLVENTVEVFIG